MDYFWRCSINQATSKFLIDMGFSISVYYGMTEVSCTATWGVLDRKHAESAGRFCEYIRYRFQDDELMMTGPTLMKGYYKIITGCVLLKRIMKERYKRRRIINGK